VAPLKRSGLRNGGGPRGQPLWRYRWFRVAVDLGLVPTMLLNGLSGATSHVRPRRAATRADGLSPTECDREVISCPVGLEVRPSFIPRPAGWVEPCSDWPCRCPLALLQLRQGWRCGWEGTAVAALAAVALNGRDPRAPWCCFPTGFCWRLAGLGPGAISRAWWLTWGSGPAESAAPVFSGGGGAYPCLACENLWVLITAAAAALLGAAERVLATGPCAPDLPAGSDHGGAAGAGSEP